MFNRLNNPKIRADHLERKAFIYIRQSTLVQVRDNTGSKARQYDLVQRAMRLGWAQENIIVIDQDQGHSGASIVGRDGFQALVSEVGLGHAGAVLSLEVSRLARSCSDWYRLIEICGLSNTLVIDEEGIYDPNQYNDRLLLGFKGTMSEAELHWLHSRLQGGKLEKAQNGGLRFRPPSGLVYDPLNHIILDPDEQVQQAVRLVFDLFNQFGSAMAVVQYFNTNQLLFPTRSWGGTKDGELTWQALSHGRMLAILHNPAYAGAYVYGKTQTRTKSLPGEAPRVKGRTRQVKMHDWPIVLKDVHPAYISWDQFLRNLQCLDDNRTWRPDERRGAPREGQALLQGIVLCGRCGRRMSVRYLQDGSVWAYVCAQAHSQHAEKTCQFLTGNDIDTAVAQTFLVAMQPAQLEVSMAAFEQIEGRAQQVDRQWQLRIERSRYEADLARRRFYAIDPENRLVARTLEHDWNDKLTQVEQLEHEYEALPKWIDHLVSPEERQRILTLAQDLPAIWQAPTTSHTERKQLLRFLIKDVTLTRQDTSVQINIRWQTEAVTAREVACRPKSCDLRRTSPAVVERVRVLARDHTDLQVANLLNQEGLSPGLGGTFSASKVQWIRYTYQIANNCPKAPGLCPTGQRGDGRYSARTAAQLLNVNVSTIADWCKAGILDHIQETPHGPRWISLTPETIAALRKPIQRRWQKHIPT
ncbi:MAG: recombinase family protein [Anaerolineales bacterium]|jgi:DNA invertase Pin-like site-specific DNA recombinase